MTSFSALDRHFMEQALRLAERGRGKTRPNPMVGSVITRRDEAIAHGYHRQAGKAHAEIVALKRIGMRAPGCTLYVTLEPCAHTGRTGPCVDAILASGVKRVVVGCEDENPCVAGRGIARLRRSGIQVDVGCLAQDCQELNRGFFTWITQHRPTVTLKAAATFDGFIGDRNEKKRSPEARWITGPLARKHAHALRAKHDAIVVGIGTVLADDPRLTARLPRRTWPIQRIVLDSRLQIPLRAQIFQPCDAPPPWIVAGAPKQPSRSLKARKRRIEATGAKVLFMPCDQEGRPRLMELLTHLSEHGLQSLLVEGGSKVHGAFLSAGLVDRIVLYLAPKLVGHGVPMMQGPGPGFWHPLHVDGATCVPLGEDWLVTGTVARHNDALKISFPDKDR